FLTSGSHRITFEALKPGTLTTFQNIRLELIPDWQDPWTWNCLAVPTAADSAIVPPGVAVGMKQTMTARAVVANGELLAVQNRMFSFTGKTMLISGPSAYLEIGRASTPYYRNGVITLTGVVSDTLSLFPIGSKFLAGTSGAVLEVHGADKMSWTRLNAQANAGTAQITVSDAVDWNIGDSIVITTTDYDPHQSEVRTITAISTNKKTLTLNSTLAFMHYGKIDTFSSPYRDHYLDHRAEVGVLTRNLKIQGDIASETSHYGAHVVIVGTAKGYFSGVEFLRSGQEGLLGRYPFHWHHGLNVSGEYIRSCAIHRSYNRIVTVHNSQNALVEEVVGYDHLGHGFFLEAGSETGCLFKNNLGILTRLPDSIKAVRPHDFVKEGNLVKLPATYWITNPGNDFIGNVAAGSEGSGFWQVNLNAPLEGSTPQAPRKTPMGINRGNSSHSTSFSNYSIDGGINPVTHAFTVGHYSPEVGGNQSIPIVENFTAHHCLSRSLWMRANTMRFEDCASADSRMLTLFAFNHIYHNSLLVGISPNGGNPQSANEILAGRSLPDSSKPASAWQNRVDGYPVYDGPAEFRKTHFAGFTGGNAFCIRPNGAATKSPVHRVDSLTFDPAIAAADKVDFDYFSYKDHQWSSGVIDLDGSLTGTAGIRITPNIRHPAPGIPAIVFDSLFNVEPGAFYNAGWNAWYTTKRYALYRLDNKWLESVAAPIYMIRSDDHAVLSAFPAFSKFQTSVIVDDTFSYRWQYHHLANRVDSYIRFANNGEQVVGVFDNVASSTLALDGNNNPIPQASSLTNLMSSTTQKYWLQDNTLYLKHIAANGGSDWTFGNQYSAKSPIIRVCQNANCANPTAATSYMTLADFEWGADSRTSLSGTIPTGTLAYDVGATPFDAVNNKVTWTVNGDADGNDEYVDLNINFPRQVWTGYQTIRIYWTGDSVEVRLHDKSIPDTSLGIYAPDTSYLDIRLALTAPYYKIFDEVTGITLRVHERFLGALSANTSQQYELFDILLFDKYTTTGKRLETVFSEGLEPEGLDNFTLYPNPSAGTFTLEKLFQAPDKAVVTVYDQMGKVIFRKSDQAEAGTWRMELDSRELGLSPGIYHVMLSTDKHGQAGKKLVISR
ncbi:MAG TPA: T9SS type A sorting domain-containing protein, partial [Bacteroidetes bacterium]|nr:T9SS type A sorting domain-containing protein [Bacteroidota bacterium]